MSRLIYNRLEKTLILCACLVAGCFVASSFLAPLLNVLSYPDGEFFYEALSRICHQDFSRVLYLWGHPHGLCARCLGGYIGVLAGIAAVSLQQGKSREYFILAYAVGSTILIVAIVDALVKFGDSNAYRIISGFFGGIGFGCMLAASSAAAFRRKIDA